MVLPMEPRHRTIRPDLVARRSGLLIRISIKSMWIMSQSYLAGSQPSQYPLRSPLTPTLLHRRGPCLLQTMPTLAITSYLSMMSTDSHPQIPSWFWRVTVSRTPLLSTRSGVRSALSAISQLFRTTRPRIPGPSPAFLSRRPLAMERTSPFGFQHRRPPHQAQSKA